jgi:hypothetical protein
MLSPFLDEIAREKITRLLSEAGTPSSDIVRRDPLSRFRLPALAAIAELRLAGRAPGRPFVPRRAAYRA